MNIETNRLNTFTNWPASAPVDPIRIAKAGFFYTGERTEVQCFSCGGKISEWNYGDQVMWRHRRLKPNCSFVVNPQLSGNVPLILGRECPSNMDASLVTLTQELPDSTQSMDYGLTEEDEMYRSDALRLLSFINWDDTSVPRESLVNAGFYHAGDSRLRCAWCGGELATFVNFASLGQPLDVHRMYFPRCAHAAALEVAQRTRNMLPSAFSLPYVPAIQPPPDTTTNQPQSSGAAHNERLLAAGGTWRSLGVVGGGPRHPTQAALASRLATFEGWPANRTQTPRTLAEAGFFYTGTDDQVRCFYCDGGLGKWEASDTPWSEHAHWFPHCGYVLLVKGQQYVDVCRARVSVQRCHSAESGLSSRRRVPGVNFPVTESQVEECMESDTAMAALGAGLDAARVRRALVRRLRATGLPFNSSEALIDAVLDEQLNEEAWSVSPHSQRLARDILAETLRDFAPRTGITPPSTNSSDSRRSHSVSPARPQTPTAAAADSSQPTPDPFDTTIFSIFADSARSQSIDNVRKEIAKKENKKETTKKGNEKKEETPIEKKKLTLEEENRQLKEARLCKVCMDSEVSVVFLPCGHLVSCGGCGAALAACPLCRCAVRALVRAYLA